MNLSTPSTDTMFRFSVAICPVIIGSNTLLSGLVLGFGSILIFSILSLSLPYINRLVSKSLHLHVGLMLSGLLSAAYGLIVKSMLPLQFPELAVFIYLLALNGLVLNMIWGLADEETSEKSGGYIFDACKLAGMVVFLGALRELLGTGALGLPMFAFSQPLADSASSSPLLLALMPAGGFLLLGYALAAYKTLSRRLKGIKA